MPSEDRRERAVEALENQTEGFRSAVARSVDEVRTLLESRAVGTPATRAGEELGAFAAGRIDEERFAGLFAGSEPLDPGSADRVRRAHDVLAGIDAGADDLLTVEVDGGGSLVGTVGRALASVGRAFGAARTVELARLGSFRPDLHEGFMDAFPFRMWNRAERSMAPPLVVGIDGSDVDTDGLAAFMDGGLDLVLVVDGDPPAAPLVRLITPGVAVVQSDDPADLAVLSGHDGPGIAMLVREGAERTARFVHDPTGGAFLPDRLRVDHLPAVDVLRPVGRASAWQVAEELRQLAELAAAASTPSAASRGRNGDGEPEDVEPADRLAAWLLRQANLGDLG